MKKLIYILFVAFAIVCLSTMGEEQHGGDVQRYEVKECVDKQQHNELICCRECNGDMMLRSSRSVVSVGQNSHNTINNSVRSRHESHTKTLAKAVVESHAGHLTRIFEFNHFRSSLRVTYYLYALCRLRI